MSDKRPYAISRYINNVDFIPEYVEGAFEIPFIQPMPYKPVKEYIPFNLANTTRTGRENKGVHFFIHDYQFEGLWANRNKYSNLLRQFKVILSPDFSPYMDWPIMVQRWNHYRKHLLGAWMQEIGCLVYPTITWSDKRSLEWCFEGEPVHSTVCVSSVGMMRYKESVKLFMDGYNRMLEILEPETILFYGSIPKECVGNIVEIDTYQKRVYRKGGKRNDKT